MAWIFVLQGPLTDLIINLFQINQSFKLILPLRSAGAWYLESYCADRFQNRRFPLRVSFLLGQTFVDQVVWLQINASHQSSIRKLPCRFSQTIRASNLFGSYSFKICIKKLEEKVWDKNIRDKFLFLSFEKRQK